MGWALKKSRVFFNKAPKKPHMWWVILNPELKKKVLFLIAASLSIGSDLKNYLK